MMNRVTKSDFFKFDLINIPYRYLEYTLKMDLKYIIFVIAISHVNHDFQTFSHGNREKFLGTLVLKSNKLLSILS